MKSNKAKHAVKRISLTGLMAKRMVSIMLCLMLVGMMAGCGSDAQQQEAQITTESSSTENGVNAGVSESEQDIADAADDTAESDVPDVADAGDDTEDDTEGSDVTAVVDGKVDNGDGTYTYTVYGDVKITMDVDVDKYISVSQYTGNTVFWIDELAADYGWNQPAGEYANDPFIYNNGDMAILFSFYDDYNEKISSCYDCRQISSFDYSFVPKDDLPNNPFNVVTDYYYENPSMNCRGLHVHIDKHYSDCRYVLYPNNFVCGSRDDIVIIAYIIAFVKIHPGENPFYYSDILDYFGYGQNTADITLDLP